MSDWLKGFGREMGMSFVRGIKDQIELENRKQQAEHAHRKKRVILVFVLLLSIVIIMVARMKGVFNGIL